MEQKWTAEQALEARIKAVRKYSGVSISKRIENEIIAHNVLREELGKFADADLLPTYDLDQDMRDRFLAHTRHDAAHAVINTISLMAEVDDLKRAVRRLTLGLWMLVAPLCVLIATYLMWVKWK